MRNTGHPEGSYYRATANPFPAQPPLEGEVETDVCVIGAGYTGLGAALELASRGASVVVLEQAEVGSGGSGRNGGQLHSGQRRDQAWLEQAVGEADARALWRLAEDARAYVISLIRDRSIACDFRPGVLHVRRGGDEADEADEAAYADWMAERYGYELLEPVGRDAVASELGSGAYAGGLIDHGGGHLHPLNFALGLAQAAIDAGAVIHEWSRVTGWRAARRFQVTTPKGRVTAHQLILTGDGYVDGLSPAIEAHVAPINNFIAATEPLAEELGILRPGRAVADDRFVVNYFRKSADGRLIYGGGETYRRGFPADIASFVRRHMLQVYPQLAGARIDYAWGGTLGITVTRTPYVAEVAPGAWTAAGYSGQGVALAPYFGKLLADAALGERAGVELLARLRTPPFPGGRWLRGPITAAGLRWYSLRDRLGWSG